ncbi:MAG: cyclopropane fatty acyl phospholipid synthase [Gammaproteobacteria bacterium]
MTTQIEKTIITDLLKQAGITVNGNNPWDIQVHNEQMYSRIFRDHTVGAGESYVDGWWDCAALDMFFDRVIRADIENKIKKNYRLLFKILLARISNWQTPKNAFVVGKRHYDLGNDLFTGMLDQNMNYTCGYWKNASALEEAQLAKLELICQKLKLQPGMRILDIGCGFGAFAKYAAKKYQANIVGVTISEKQAEYAKENCRDLPIDIRLQDYRDITEKFDRVVSIGMFEHVGYMNYHNYMRIVHDCLPDEGIFLLHTIGSNHSVYKADEWITKYIFPHGMLPSIAQIGKSIEDFFIMEDWHNFGIYYDKTLMAWHHNFNQHWDELKLHYGDRFYRMWNYYLLLCAGGFRSRSMQVWQIVLSKKGLTGGYDAPR